MYALRVASTIIVKVLSWLGVNPMTPRAPKPKPRKIEAHRTLWTVVVFDPKVDTLIGFYHTKEDAYAGAAKVKGAFVLPPMKARGGKESA